MTTNDATGDSCALKQAYACCGSVVAAHDENFPVASLLLPPAMRPHVAAVYAFARIADDFSDERSWSDAERHHLINDWLARLHRCGDKAATAETCTQLDDRDQIFLALGETIRRCRLPLALFEDLLSAFRQDITTHRYDTWEALLEYCQRSANPIGRLVLRIAGHRDDALDRASDSLCTALQLTNFWQDLGRDWRRGRLYLPAEDWRRCGARETDLEQGCLTDSWRCALERAAARTRVLYGQGRRVCDGVGGRLGLELRLTWLGGIRMLRRLESARFDVFTTRPTLGAADVPFLVWNALTWGFANHQNP